MIKAILLDVDGVLVNEEKKYFSHFLEEEHGIPRTVTNRFFENEFLACVEGKQDLRKILPKYLAEWGWQGTLDDALTYWHTKEHILNEPLIGELEGYKEKEVKIYTATNQEIHRTNYIREDMGFGRIFDEVISSSMLGTRKPNVLFYERILERVGFQPDETLFWDDSEENIKAAREIGMHAEVYDGFETFKKIMKEKYSL